jgi:hypothetical protein
MNIINKIKNLFSGIVNFCTNFEKERNEMQKNELIETMEKNLAFLKEQDLDVIDLEELKEAYDIIELLHEEKQVS